MRAQMVNKNPEGVVHLSSSLLEIFGNNYLSLSNLDAYPDWKTVIRLA